MVTATAKAAKALCELGEWRVSNLVLQKQMYIAHMVHLGRLSTPLVSETFEAWDNGPVLPSLYARLAMFGADPVKDVFFVDAPPEGGPDYALLREITEFTRPMTPGQMVALTHWRNGAWAKVYRPGVRHIPIPNQFIADEFRARQQRQ